MENEELWLKLLSDFDSVIVGFNQLVSNKDKAGIQNFFKEVENLINEKQGIVLDDRESDNYDHVLHELLSKISGKIDKPSYYTNDQVNEMIVNAYQELTTLELQRDIGTRESSEIEVEIAKLQARINELQGYLVSGKEYSLYPIENNIDKNVESVDVNSVDASQTYIDSVAKDIEEQIKNREALIAGRGSQLSADKFQELKEWKNDLADIKNGNPSEKVLKLAIDKEIEDLKIKIDHREALIAGRGSQLNTYKFQELEEWKKRLSDLQRTRNGNIAKNKETDELDVKVQVNNIGEKIFKTSEIRRELASRDISRDEFIEYYEEGMRSVEQQLKEIYSKIDEINTELKAITTDRNSDKSLNVQLKEAVESDDKAKIADVLENIRKNFIVAGKENELNEAGINGQINSSNAVEKMQNFYNDFKKSKILDYKKYSEAATELKENFYIFFNERNKVEHEKSVIEQISENKEELIEQSSIRKNFRKKLLEASITPEKNLTDEQNILLNKWQIASERFLSKKIKKDYEYIDENGETQTIKIDSIDSEYPEYEDDIDFLGVMSYKENLEQVSAYEQTYDPYVFGEEFGRMYDEAEIANPGSGEKLLLEHINDKKKYVETFNGIPNPHKVKYETWKTAGSTLKGMQSVDNTLPMVAKTKNIVGNAFRFLGIRKPEFTKYDEHGNKVSNVKGGIATLAVDGLVIGGVYAVGPAIATAGYAAKGIVTVGNKVAAKREYSKYKDEIDGNKPVLNQANSDSREVARKQYYRENGDNRFVSFFKAKLDKYVTRTREKETEEAIVNKLVNQFEERENKRIEELINIKETVDSNQRIRLERQKQVAMGANAYNDIIRNPDVIDMDEATAAIARNAALKSYGKDAKEDVNKEAKEPRTNQYIKDEADVSKTKKIKDIDEIEKKYDDPISAITEEQIYTGRKQKVDRINKLLTVITAAGLKMGMSALKDEFYKDRKIEHEPEYEKQTVHQEEIVEQKTINVPEEVVYKDVTHEEYVTDLTLEDIIKNNADKNVEAWKTVWKNPQGMQEGVIRSTDKITAIYSDKDLDSISDLVGLNQSTGFTERNLVGDLVDANGYFKQDVDINKFIEKLNITENADIDKLYVSIGDRHWVKLSDLLPKNTITEQVVDHVVPAHTETVTEVIQEAKDSAIDVMVKEGYTETVREFSKDLVKESLKDGVKVGAGIGIADQLHESVQTTYINDTKPGRPEEVTPKATEKIDQIIEKLQDEVNKERTKQMNQEREDEEMSR